MTIEEIEQTLQTVAENQARFSSDIGALREQTEKLTSAGAVLEEAAALHQQVLRGHESRQAKLEDAFRQVAESHQALVQLAGIHEERLDSHEEGQAHTDARLDALIDSQIQLTQRVDTLTGAIAALNGHFEQTDERLDRMSERAEVHDQQLGQIDERLDRMSERAEVHDQQLGQIDERLNQAAALQNGNAEQIKALIEAQARTDEQIRLLLDRNGAGSKKGGAK